MADIAAFPTVSIPLNNQGNTYTFTASGTINPGQVVCFADAATTNVVLASIAGAGTKPVGVATTYALTGKPVTVALVGSIVTVANADDTATIDAGHGVICNDNAVGGTVSEVLAVGSSTVPQEIVGMLIEDMAASGTAKMIVLCGTQTTMHA